MLKTKIITEVVWRTCADREDAVHSLRGEVL